MNSTGIGIGFGGDSYLDDGICDTKNDPTGDPPISPSGICTLIGALQQAAAIPGHHTIQFSIPVVPPTRSFAPFKGISGVSIEGSVTIDMSWGLPGASDNWGLSLTDTMGFHITDVWIKGTGSAASGYTFNEAGILIGGSTPVTAPCVIEDSEITGVYNPLTISFLTPSSGCRFANNRIGIDADDNRVGNYGGVYITGDSHEVVNNTISGVQSGVALSIVGNDVLIKENMIGTDPTGMEAVFNDSGIAVNGDRNELWANVVSASLSVGVTISGSENDMYMNRIGTDATGNTALANRGDGVQVFGSLNCIGTLRRSTGECEGSSMVDEVQEANLISGNMAFGIYVSGGGNNIIAFNTVGLNILRTAGLGNLFDGVRITENSEGNKVLENVIGGNSVEIYIDPGSTANEIRGNFIGTDGTGTLPIGNSFAGILVWAATDNIIGGTDGTTPGGPCTGACNLISANRDDGIKILDGEATGNVVQGNFIGTDVTGTRNLGNAGDGLFVVGSSIITIGGAEPGAGNTFGANGRYGIHLHADTGPANLMVQGNIFTNIIKYGIEASLNAGGSYTIGGETEAEGNIFIGAMMAGAKISILGDDITLNYQRNTHLGNMVGLDLVESVSGTVSGTVNIFDGNEISLKAELKAAGKKVLGSDSFTGETSGSAHAKINVDAPAGTHIDPSLAGLFER